ncbi:hypothetical protein P7C70_g7862, partial [Phenoliferia sp. Uapishka_3]
MSTGQQRIFPKEYPQIMLELRTLFAHKPGNNYHDAKPDFEVLCGRYVRKEMVKSKGLSLNQRADLCGFVRYHLGMPHLEKGKDAEIKARLGVPTDFTQTKRDQLEEILFNWYRDDAITPNPLGRNVLTSGADNMLRIAQPFSHQTQATLFAQQQSSNSALAVFISRIETHSEDETRARVADRDSKDRTQRLEDAKKCSVAIVDEESWGFGPTAAPSVQVKEHFYYLADRGLSSSATPVIAAVTWWAKAHPNAPVSFADSRAVAMRDENDPTKLYTMYKEAFKPSAYASAFPSTTQRGAYFQAHPPPAPSLTEEAHQALLEELSDSGESSNRILKIYEGPWQSEATKENRLLLGRGGITGRSYDQRECDSFKVVNHGRLGEVKSSEKPEGAKRKRPGLRPQIFGEKLVASLGLCRGVDFPSFLNNPSIQTHCDNESTSTTLASDNHESYTVSRFHTFSLPPESELHTDIPYNKISSTDKEVLGTAEVETQRLFVRTDKSLDVALPGTFPRIAHHPSYQAELRHWNIDIHEAAKFIRVIGNWRPSEEQGGRTEEIMNYAFQDALLEWISMASESMVNSGQPHRDQVISKADYRLLLSHLYTMQQTLGKGFVLFVTCDQFSRLLPDSLSRKTGLLIVVDWKVGHPYPDLFHEFPLAPLYIMGTLHVGTTNWGGNMADVQEFAQLSMLIGCLSMMKVRRRRLVGLPFEAQEYEVANINREHLSLRQELQVRRHDAVTRLQPFRFPSVSSQPPVSAFPSSPFTLTQRAGGANTDVVRVIIGDRTEHVEIVHSFFNQNVAVTDASLSIQYQKQVNGKSVYQGVLKGCVTIAWEVKAKQLRARLVSKAGLSVADARYQSYFDQLEEGGPMLVIKSAGGLLHTRVWFKDFVGQAFLSPFVDLCKRQELLYPGTNVWQQYNVLPLFFPIFRACAHPLDDIAALLDMAGRDEGVIGNVKAANDRWRKTVPASVAVNNVEAEEVGTTKRIDEAYEVLEMKVGDDPELLIAAYETKITESPEQAETMREALANVGAHLRNAKINDVVKSFTMLPGELCEAIPWNSLDRPVGLTNIANTCYLNSILQYLFTVRELRETILTYSGDFAAVTRNDELPRVGGRLVTKAEVERSRRFALLLHGLFNQLNHSPTSAVTPETELAYLALVPSKEEATATATREIEDAAAESAMDVLPSEAEIGAPDMQMMQSDSAPSPPSHLPPREGRWKGQGVETTGFEKELSDYMSFGKQIDVAECMENVMFQLQCALNPTSLDSDEGEAASLVKRTFYGKMKQKLEFDDPIETDQIRVQGDPFFSLLVNVDEPGHDLYDGLDAVFDDAIVEIGGKKARRSITMKDVPRILHIQLQRVQYDRVAQRAFKSNAHLSFGETVYMDRYLEVDPSDSAAVERRDRTAGCRERMETARSTLSDLTKIKRDEIGEDFAVALEAEMDRIRVLVDKLRSEISAIWIDQQSTGFELVSIFMHQGGESSGHYYLYQRDSKKPERWFKCNDSFVSVIDPKEEVFGKKMGDVGDTNAYLLVYCRKDSMCVVIPITAMSGTDEFG